MILRVIKDKVNRYIKFYQNKKKYPEVKFNLSVEIDSSSILEGANSIGENSIFKGTMGYGSYMGCNCYIHGNIGRFTSIASDVQCNLGVHPYKHPYVSTSPMFFSLLKQNGQTFAQKQMFDEIKSPISIGNDCWIGQRVFIAGGIKINDGAVVYAGAVVTKDVPPYAIVGGVPAKILGYRYSDEIINMLLHFKWWDKPIVWLKENYEYFSNLEEFLSLIGKTGNDGIEN